MIRHVYKVDKCGEQPFIKFTKNREEKTKDFSGFAFISNNNLRREKSFQYSIIRALFFALKRKNIAKLMIFTISIAKMCKNGPPT